MIIANKTDDIETLCRNVSILGDVPARTTWEPSVPGPQKQSELRLLSEPFASDAFIGEFLKLARHPEYQPCSGITARPTTNYCGIRKAS